MIVIDYVDGRARTERITDSSSTTISTSHPSVNSNGLITEVTIQPHQQSHEGTFVDSSDGGSGSSPPPPPHPPRMPSSQLHNYHGHMHLRHGHHRLHHLHSHHIHSSIPPGRPPSGSGGDSSGYHSSGGNPPKTNLRSSRSSDSSSAYSGSDTMQSPGGSSGDVEEVDLSGLMESVVDSDEDEEEESLLVRDAVRECLEKDPSDRGPEDIDTLLEFTQHLKAFTNMTLSVRRALVATMVFAVVEKAGTVVMTDGEELDSWSVIINGQVEVLDQACGQQGQELHLGDSFGITPTMDKLYHKGVMRTKCDDCQFVCVTQTDYYRILHQGEESQKRHEDMDGKVVLVTENRAHETEPGRRGHLVIRGTSHRLMAQLMEDNSDLDPTYIEDFLLTYRTFLHSPTVLANQLLEWFADASLRDKVTRVLLLWVNNHFTDFETDPGMIEFLEKFESALEGEKMQGQLRMLNFACAAKARKRTVTLTRPSRDEPLQFAIVGGFERGFGIFISRVEKGSKAEEIGLKRGDQILEVNGQSFEHGTRYARALEILKSVCHLSVTVKSNLLAFQEMLQTPEDTPRSSRSRGKSTSGRINETCSSTDPNNEMSNVDGRSSSLSTVHSAGTGNSGSRDNTPTPSTRKTSPPTATATGASSNSSKGKSKINKAFGRFLHKPKSLMNVDSLDERELERGGQQPHQTGSGSHSLHLYSNSMSNPDLLRGERDNSNSSTIHHHQDSDSSHRTEYPEHVLKVYKSDQTFKYLLVHKETTAHEVVMLSLQEFGITEPSSNFSLCEVSVAEGGFVKQRTLPDPLQNLAERIGLASRYYIKSKNSSESLLPDDNVNDLVKDAAVNLLQLNPVEVSTQLMVEDFTIFRQIEATEYVDDLYELSIQSGYGTPSLTLFAELVNREMMWTIGEIVSESNATKRMRVIKQFIKVARQCKETQNFNSMFAIISGLGHGAVSRLKSSWEKLPTKYQRLFNEMQQLMDPSRNMSRYRNLVNGEDVQPPIVPFYPVVKKDLTFIHLANDTSVDGLVNFEKLRMIAKEVRSLINMCSAPLDLFSMLELGGQQPSNAMVAMNQLTTGGQQNLATVNRRRKKPQGVPNPKRMFEEAQMVRRVKAYLKNMKVITDEDKLHAMSLECEPPIGGSSTSAAPAIQIPQPSLRKRNPSPTPSAVSSTSSALSNPGDKSKPKFGAASPQAVKKLLALSEPPKVSRGPTKSPSTPPPPIHRRAAAGCNKALAVVDLTAESSSVTASCPTRKGHHHAQSGSVTSNDSGLGFYDYNNHVAADHHLNVTAALHRRVAPRPPPPLLPTSSSSSRSQRLKIGSSQQRVAVHHAVPAEVLHRDHSILINNRLVVKSSTGSSCSDSKNSSSSTKSSLSSSAIRKTVFYNPNNNADDETQVSAV